MQINLNGMSFAYDDINGKSSSKPVILFIHGYPLNRHIWQPQIRSLSSITRLLIPDLRGFGNSEATPGIYPMDLLAEDCAALLDKLEIAQPIILCGLSMGGYVAFSFYKKFPNRVRGLILVSSRAHNDTPEVKENRNKAIALTEKEGTEAILRLMLPVMLAQNTYRFKLKVVDRVRKIISSASAPGILGVLAGMRDRQDSTPLLPNINIPTMLIFGDDDQFVPRTEINEMRDAIPNAELHIIPKAGHLPNIEQPGLFNKITRAYITSLVKI